MAPRRSITSRPPTKPAATPPKAPRPRPQTSASGSRVTQTAVDKWDHAEEEKEELGAIVFPPGCEPAFVRVAMGQTYNLGNYESLRLDVSVTLPCLPADVHKTYEEASDFCAEKLLAEQDQWLPVQAKGKGSR